MNLLKKRLVSAKGKWMKEFPGALWVVRTSPHKSNNKTFFSLVYGIEGVIPIEVVVPIIRSTLIKKQNGENRAIELALAKEKNEALRRILEHKRKVLVYYSKAIRFKVFSLRDWILRRVFLNKKEWMVGKMGAN